MLSRGVVNPEATERIRELFNKLGWSQFPEEFKPIIYYNEELEIVEVLTADTSYTETQLTEVHFLAVFERNHHVRYGEEHFVGFNLWVVKSVLVLMGSRYIGTHSMRQILEFLHEREKDQFVRECIRDIVLPILEAHNLDEFEIKA